MSSSFRMFWQEISILSQIENAAERTLASWDAQINLAQVLSTDLGISVLEALPIARDAMQVVLLGKPGFMSEGAGMMPLPPEPPPRPTPEPGRPPRNPIPNPSGPNGPVVPA